MLLAQGDTAGWWVGLAGILAAVGAVVVNVIVSWAKARAEAAKAAHDAGLADKTDVWGRQAALIDRLDKQLSAVQAEQQRSLVAEMACREEVARLRALGQWLYDLNRVMHAAMERAGLHPDPMPQFPDFSSLSSTTAAEREFVQRTTEHVTGLVHEEVDESKQADAGGGGPGP
jgi:hypothetical protein